MALFILVLFVVLLTPFFFMRVEDVGRIIILVDTSVYIAKIVAHMATLVEVFSFYDVGKRMQKAILRLDEDIGIKLYQKMKSLQTLNTDVYFNAFLLIMFIVFNYVIIITTNGAYESSKLNLFQWFSFFSAIACKVRIVQVIVDLAKIRIRLTYFHEAILNLNKVRKPFSMSEGKLPQLDLKMEKILALKIIYDKIFGVCQDINNCYGSSLLAIVASAFIDITSNCYKIFLIVEVGQDHSVRLVYSFSIILQMVMLIWILCWHSHQCTVMVRLLIPYIFYNILTKYFQPAAIGSAIMELESPDYGQEYSSLLSEFSLQIIHQPIYITARRFLVFNLSFISSVSVL